MSFALAINVSIQYLTVHKIIPIVTAGLCNTHLCPKLRIKLSEVLVHSLNTNTRTWKTTEKKALIPKHIGML